MPESVAIIYSDVKRVYFSTEEQYLTEKDAFEDAKTVASYLRKLGIRVSLLPGNATLPQRLKSRRPEMVFNLVDSVKGSEYLAATIPAVLELLEIPYTGSGIIGKSLDCNKFLVNKLLRQHGVPVPNLQLFSNATEPLDTTLRFPLIAKLNEVHGAVEINEDAVSETERHLRERIKFLIKAYNQPVIVQEFIVGREVIAYVLEGQKKRVYLAERIFNKENRKFIFATFTDQWKDKEYSNTSSFNYQKYNDKILNEYARKAFDICKFHDYGKFDVRIDGSGRYFFIDINYNPSFGPKERTCALGAVLDLYGVSFVEILKRLISNTIRDAEGKKLLPIISS